MRTTTILLAYDHQHARWLLQYVTPQQVVQQLQSTQFGDQLMPNEREELEVLLDDWIMRALGLVTLRDAVWVDPQRGQRIYHLLCRSLTKAECTLPPDLPMMRPLEVGKPLLPEHIRLVFHSSLPAALNNFLTLAEQERLAVMVCHGPTVSYSLPSDLDMLQLPQPSPYTPPPNVIFRQPTGWRRTAAFAFVLSGVAALGVPLLTGSVPVQPAGLPLGLLTLGLLVGIRAQWQGYVGSVCLWLVPNLPGFHYDANPSAFLHAIPLLISGSVLLISDAHVRAMWRWILRRPRP